MPPAHLMDAHGRPVPLGRQLGVGGEGAVFEVTGSCPTLVAKVYHKPPRVLHQAKLRAMVGLAREELLRVAAWPVTTLHAQVGGPVAGVAMRKVEGRELHELYSPAHR